MILTPACKSLVLSIGVPRSATERSLLHVLPDDDVKESIRLCLKFLQQRANLSENQTNLIMDAVIVWQRELVSRGQRVHLNDLAAKTVGELLPEGTSRLPANCDSTPPRPRRDFAP